MGMRAAVLVAVLCSEFVLADVYMHNPRGNNNRLKENAGNTNNQQRLFDSQNNAKGGYGLGDDTDGSNKPMFFYYGNSTLMVEWTNQHACGANSNTHCDVVLQYYCNDEADNKKVMLRDGTDNDRINVNDPEDLSRGMHEPFYTYDACRTRSRNKGLFTADRLDQNDDEARDTRQNPNGNDNNRNGFECPEERDYYPYWHPSVWRDIAILTTHTDRCPQIQAASQNIAPKGQCCKTDETEADTAGFCTDTTCMQHETADNCAAQADDACAWREFASWKDRGEDVRAPECVQAPYSRDNHLGNSGQGFNSASSYNWTIPNMDFSKCILRIRYNISTGDYAYNASAADNERGLMDDGVNTYPVEGRNPNQNQQNGIQTDMGFGEEGTAAADTGKNELIMALNSNQYGRTFQDRTHLFGIKPREQAGSCSCTGETDKTENALKATCEAVDGCSWTPVESTAKIHNLNIRGRRGNIVQCYPAVEYDFVPNNLHVAEGDYVHFQWTGSRTNSQNTGPNNGEGTTQTDRHNIVQTFEANENIPMHKTKVTMFPDESTTRLFALQNQKDCKTFGELQTDQDAGNSNIRENPQNCMKLNAAQAYFNSGLIKFPAAAEGESGGKKHFRFMCTRNNNFSNRSQKGVITSDSGTMTVAGNDVAGVKPAQVWVPAFSSAAVPQIKTLGHAPAAAAPSNMEPVPEKPFASGVFAFTPHGTTFPDDKPATLFIPYDTDTIVQPRVVRLEDEHDEQWKEVKPYFGEPAGLNRPVYRNGVAIVNVTKFSVYAVVNNNDWATRYAFLVWTFAIVGITLLCSMFHYIRDANKCRAKAVCCGDTFCPCCLKDSGDDDAYASPGYGRSEESRVRQENPLQNRGAARAPPAPPPFAGQGSVPMSTTPAVADGSARPAGAGKRFGQK